MVFKNALAFGEKKVIHTALLWLLQKMPELKKRAYLAKYLLPFEVPPEMTGEDGILSFYHSTVPRLFRC